MRRNDLLIDKNSVHKIYKITYVRPDGKPAICYKYGKDEKDAVKLAEKAIRRKIRVITIEQE